jgi:hypothetical protein
MKITKFAILILINFVLCSTGSCQLYKEHNLLNFIQSNRIKSEYLINRFYCQNDTFLSKDNLKSINKEVKSDSLVLFVEIGYATKPNFTYRTQSEGNRDFCTEKKNYIVDNFICTYQCKGLMENMDIEINKFKNVEFIDNVKCSGYIRFKCIGDEKDENSLENKRIYMVLYIAIPSSFKIDEYLDVNCDDLTTHLGKI